MGRRDCVVVNAVDAGGRVEAEPCGSCRLAVVVGQRRQASKQHRHTSHPEPAASWARQRHSLHLLIFWGSEGGIYCCLLKVASNTIHSSSSSREQQSLYPALLPSPPSRSHDCHETPHQRPAKPQGSIPSTCPRPLPASSPHPHPSTSHTVFPVIPILGHLPSRNERITA